MLEMACSRPPRAAAGDRATGTVSNGVRGRTVGELKLRRRAQDVRPLPLAALHDKPPVLRAREKMVGGLRRRRVPSYDYQTQSRPSDAALPGSAKKFDDRLSPQRRERAEREGKNGLRFYGNRNGHASDEHPPLRQAYHELHRGKEGIFRDTPLAGLGARARL
ncbi:unnamed protein product [Diplocarpon coronariae]|nr:hypothetical protein JHW43_008455 [Diplocarpon mali]